MEACYKDIISNRSVIGIDDVWIDINMKLNVKFKNGKGVSFKIDDNLRLFLSVMKDVSCIRVESDSSAIPSPLTYYSLFGFQNGDTAKFYNDRASLIIQF